MADRATHGGRGRVALANLGDVAALVRARGVRGAARVAAEDLRRRYAAWEAEAFDRCHGTDTGGDIPSEQLDGPGPNATHAARYQATNERALARVLRVLPIARREYAFVDLGSGKGRVVMLAARRGFRRVVGVEFAPSLHAVAEQNVRRFVRRAPFAAPIELRLGDAADFVPPQSPLVLYLFNPFAPPVLAAVLERLRASLERAPRPAFVAYQNPAHAHVLDGCGFLRAHAVSTAFRVYRSA